MTGLPVAPEVLVQSRGEEKGEKRGKRGKIPGGKNGWSLDIKTFAANLAGF